jgi:cell division protein FtsL
MAIKYFYWLIIAVFLLSFYVWQQTQSVRLSYRVENLKKECEKWEQENRNLRLRVNQLLSLERLDSVAKAKKLSQPGANKLIYLTN